MVLDLPETEISAADAAHVALGILLRSYSFDKYKTKKKDGEDGKKASKPARFSILCADPAGAKRAFEELEGVGDGVLLARELVNEPANILGTIEFADKAAELEKLGVKIEILTEKEMKKARPWARCSAWPRARPSPPRMVVMQWNGAKAKEKPIAFIGKGVVFDSGGHLHQAGRQHGGHEGRHGRSRRGDRSHARAGSAQGEGPTSSASSASSRTCSTAPPSGRATSSPRCPARRSRSSIRTPRAGSFWPMRSGTATTASSRNL